MQRWRSPPERSITERLARLMRSVDCIACSAIALGLLVLLEAQPPQMVSLALVAFFALFQGHAHGTEWA